MPENVKIPKNVLLLSSKPMVRSAVSRLKAKRVKEWKNKNFPIYTFQEKNSNIAISHYYYGSSAAAANLEELIQSGAENFLFISLALPMEDELKSGSIILPTRAVRDEGTSFHYLKPAKQVIGNVAIEKKLKELFKSQSVKTKTGLTWTTDAPFSKVRRTSEVVKSGALVIDNDASALFAVARHRKVSLGGLLIVDEHSIKGKITQKFKDPLKNLKAMLVSTCTSLLATTSFWISLKEEKPAVKKSPVMPKINLSQVAGNDMSISKLNSEILEETGRLSKGDEKLDDSVEALLTKKDLFVVQYERSKGKLFRGKITFKTYSKIAETCIGILSQVLANLKSLSSPAISGSKPAADFMQDTDDIIEEIYSQLNENEHIDFYKDEEVEAPRPHTNRAAVFLVNLPRRFRYKPYYRKFFDPETNIEEISHSEFVNRVKGD